LFDYVDSVSLKDEFELSGQEAEVGVVDGVWEQQFELLSQAGFQ
jgi:hypothetical protein